MNNQTERIQNAINHIKTATDVDPWAKELVAEMGKEILKAQLSCEGTTSDCISRQAVRFIETNSDSYPEEWNDDYEKGFTDALNKVIALPSAQPDLSEYSDKLWKRAYERGKAEAQPDLDEVYAHAETEAEARYHAQQRWIPCSERLPERGKDVLVTRNYDGRADHIKSCRYVEVASCYGEDDDVSWNSYSDEYKMTPKNHCVVAWMPLPEPYREGE